jgi:hypothetical protein
VVLPTPLAITATGMGDATHVIEDTLARRISLTGQAKDTQRKGETII